VRRVRFQERFMVWIKCEMGNAEFLWSVRKVTMPVVCGTAPVNR